MAIKIILDTDIGEDIDDILVTAFALNSPEFEVLAITTVDGDTQARSRIARKVAVTYGRPDVPVAVGYPNSMPNGDRAVTVGESVTQGDLAPDEEGLPPGSALWADELIARLAAGHPGEVYLLTIGAMTNIGQALVRFPDLRRNLKAVVTNGGRFSSTDVSPEIGWNLRYDPVAAAVVASAGVEWVLLPENATRHAGLGEAEESRLRQAGTPGAKLLTAAIDLWRKNKPDASRWPHLADLNTFAYLMGDWLEVRRGRAALTIAPGKLPGLGVDYAPEGPHLLGEEMTREKGAALRELAMSRMIGSAHA